MTDQKVIDKIKKLLELSTSPNEHEAKLAMGQAKRLMLRHSISETDFLVTGETPEIVEEIYSNPIFGKPGVKEVIPAIISTIAPIFGTYGVTKLDRTTRFRTYHLMGFKTNVEITKFALDSLLAQGQIDARREYRKFRTVTFGLSFWSGFAKGLHTKFSVSKSEQTEGLEIYDKVKEKLDSQTSGSFSATMNDGVARETGFQSGIDANIRAGISTTTSGKLLE